MSCGVMNVNQVTELMNDARDALAEIASLCTETDGQVNLRAETARKWYDRLRWLYEFAGDMPVRMR